jgi:hypothetical protein
MTSRLHCISLKSNKVQGMLFLLYTNTECYLINHDNGIVSSENVLCALGGGCNIINKLNFGDIHRVTSYFKKTSLVSPIN